jgi:hypothetical protein
MQVMVLLILAAVVVHLGQTLVEVMVVQVLL